MKFTSTDSQQALNRVLQYDNVPHNSGNYDWRYLRYVTIEKE